MELSKLYGRRAELLQEIAEIDKRETAAGRNYLEHEEFNARNTELTKVNGQIEVAESVEADRKRRSELSERAPKGGLEPRPTAPPNGGFRTAGEQLQAIIRAQTPGSYVDPRLDQYRAATGLNEGVGEQGGFAVQTDMAGDIWKRVYESGSILSRVRRIPISGNANAFKQTYVKETSRANGSRFGGLQVYRRAEAGTVTATKPALAEFKLELESGMALVYLTDEVMADAPQLEALVREVLPQEIATFTEDELINGNGVGKPLGILNAPSLVSVTKETGQAAATLVPQNIVKMDARIFARSVGNSVWLINQDVKPQLHLMSLAVGTGGVPVYMPANGLAGSPFGTLYGRPVIPVEHCATLGTVGDIISADWSQYVLIEKGGIQAASSIHVQFLYGENVLRFMWRNNGSPGWSWAKGALTPAKGSNTTSPFVALDTRA